METEQIEPITPSSIPDIMARQTNESSNYIEPFKQLCIKFINEHIDESDWNRSDNYTAEIPFSLWHDNFPRLLSEDAYKVYTELVKLYENKGWHVFASTGNIKFAYFTLTPQEIHDKKDWVIEAKEKE